MTSGFTFVRELGANSVSPPFFNTTAREGTSAIRLF
jgi:hypothetical protein